MGGISSGAIKFHPNRIVELNVMQMYEKYRNSH